MNKFFGTVLLNRGLAICVLFGAGLPALGQTSTSSVAPGITINLKEGKSVVTTRIRRLEGKVMATEQIGAGTGEIGYPVSAIAKVDFPEPTQIKTSADLLAQGKAPAALAQIEPVVIYYAPFKDVPGNWWAQSARLKLKALVALNRDPEAAALVDDIVKNSTDPESGWAAQALLAGSLVRKGEGEKALVSCDAVIKTSADPDTVSTAWVAKGRAHLMLKDWDSAMLAFLHVPVFYPDQTTLMPQVMLGSAQAYAGLEDKVNAEKTFNELISQYPASAEATEAKAGLQKIKQ